MMAETEASSALETLNEAVVKLQRSARQTIPMFAVGILATVIAAGVAVYYILTLSADLREARSALESSEAALAEARANLGAANSSLQQAQKNVASPADAGAIATAISDVSRSQRSISEASSSIKDATSRLAPAAAEQVSGDIRQIAGTCRLVVNSVTYLSGRCEIEMGAEGSFRIYAIGRQGPSADLRRQGRVGMGSWRAKPGDAPVAVGTLQRKGACWSNAAASICAWA